METENERMIRDRYPKPYPTQEDAQRIYDKMRKPAERPAEKPSVIPDQEENQPKRAAPRLRVIDGGNAAAGPVRFKPRLVS